MEKNTNKPKPPEDMEGEALLEWHRVVAELAARGTLDSADRGILTVHCQTRAAHAVAAKHVAQFGPVIKWPNGVPGPSPFYKTMKECAAVLCGTLADMGLTPAARAKQKTPAAEPEDADDLDL